MHTQPQPIGQAGCLLNFNGMNAVAPGVPRAASHSAQRLSKFIAVCRRVGLPPMTMSPRFAKAILPACPDGGQPDYHAFLDFVWLLRGAILGVVPCVRTASHEGVAYRIKFWARTVEGEPESRHVTAVMDTNLEGAPRLRLVLPEEQTSPPAANNTILLVENDPDVAEIEQILLEAEGFRVQWTTDGLEGLCRAQTELPAAVVLDGDLSGMDGFEVCRRLKADPKTSFLPIVLVSGYPNAPRLALAAGANKALAKPHEIAQLAACVCQLLNR